MDGEAVRHFERILRLAREHFTDVYVETYDIGEQVALLVFRCHFGRGQISVTEVLVPGRRKYSYYFLKDGAVLLGLDNARDRQALRRKYGEAFVEHLDEFIPHLHREDKQVLELTDEKDFSDFARMVEGLVPTLDRNESDV